MRSSLAVVLLLLAGCDDSPGEWAAIVYPDQTNRAKFDVTARFKTFSYCRDASSLLPPISGLPEMGNPKCQSRQQPTLMREKVARSAG